jgi:uncharacterized membrane protein
MERRIMPKISVSILLALTLWLGPGLTALRALDDMMEMEDLCEGDMQWMVGWCIDMMTAGDPGEVSALAAAAGPARYVGVFESIHVPGSSGTRAFGISPQGDIVGSYTNGTGTHGYLLRDGAFTTIDYPGAATTEAWGINPRGDIIGRYTVRGVPGVRGFLLTRGGFSDISIANHLITLPTKIGASGEIVGCFHETSGLVDMYAYVQRGSDVTLFARPSTVAPMGSATMHNGVTPGGRTVIGLHFPRPGEARGYAITGDTLTFIDFPGSTFTQAWDVNPRGTIVGDYAAGGRTHGFYYDGSSFVSLDVPASLLTVARGINPQGHIVGVYNDAAGAHGFVLRR